MHTEVFNNIDTLISMANSSLSIDEINTELISLNRQIKNKRNEIEDLKSLMNDARYFNASSELVDKNIEISLKNKISRLNRKIKDIKSTLEDIKSRENNLYKDINTLKDKISDNKKYIVNLEKKAHNATSNTYYKELLSKEEKNDLELKKELGLKEEQYTNVLKELELTNQAKEELEDKLNTEKNRLNDVLDNLNNPNAYIDEDLKHSDEEKLADLTQELEKLEKRKREIITDANMVGADAKELILNNNMTDALNKVKELVQIVKKVPYMDISSSNILEEELEKRENERMELSTLIDNKSYDAIDNNIINARIDFIKNTKEQNEKKINTYEQEIKDIDQYINDIVGPKIDELEDNVLKLEKTIHSYREILEDKNKSARTKANVENAIQKKDKEKSILNEILDNYKTNLLDNIERTNALDVLITDLKGENDNLDKEVNKLNKLSMFDLKTKDLVEEEEDKNKLKEINEEIKAIKNSQKFDKTPDEIFDEIDMYLGTFIKEELKKEEENKEKEKEIIKEEQEKESEEVLEGPKLDIDSLNNEVLKEDEPKERLKVVQVIPVSNTVGGK